MPTITNDSHGVTIHLDKPLALNQPDAAAATSGFDTIDVTGLGAAAKASITVTRVPLEGFRPTTEEHHTLAELLGKLESLGTSRAIEQFFYDEGVRGERRRSANCPVQKWLEVMTGHAYSVGSCFVHSADRRRIVAELPSPVVRFIADFDSGRYRRLELPGGNCRLALLASSAA